MKWCLLHRRMMGLFPEPESRWSGLARRHIERCDDCRQAFQNERTLIRALHRSAPPAVPEFPCALRARIVANLDRGNGGNRGHALERWHWLRPWVLAAAAVAVLVAVWPRQGSDDMTVGVVSPSFDAQPPIRASGMSWRAESSAFLQWTELGGGPLEGELANAIDDGRRLFATVVHSCVPEETAELVLARAESWISPTR
jgi:hypothetical protein